MLCDTTFYAIIFIELIIMVNIWFFADVRPYTDIVEAFMNLLAQVFYNIIYIIYQGSSWALTVGGSDFSFQEKGEK